MIETSNGTWSKTYSTCNHLYFFWLRVGVEYSYILKPKHRARHIVLLCNEYVTKIKTLTAKGEQVNGKNTKTRKILR